MFCKLDCKNLHWICSRRNIHNLVKSVNSPIVQRYQMFMCQLCVREIIFLTTKAGQLGWFMAEDLEDGLYSSWSRFDDLCTTLRYVRCQCHWPKINRCRASFYGDRNNKGWFQHRSFCRIRAAWKCLRIKHHFPLDVSILHVAMTDKTMSLPLNLVGYNQCN